MKKLIVIALGCLFSLGVQAKIKTLKNSPNRTHYFTGTVNERTADKLIEFLAGANEGNQKRSVLIVINSPGGYVISGSKIVSIIEENLSDFEGLLSKLGNFVAEMKKATKLS